MSDSTRRSFTAASLVLAIIAAAVAAVLALESLTSPLNDATLSSSVAIQSSAGDAVLAALVATALSALAITSLVASWSQPVRLSVRLAAAVIMTAAGCIAALMLDPASASLQARFMVYPHGEGMAARLHLFTPWIERLAALSWVYAACGAGLLLVTVVGAVASRSGVRRRHPRSVATPAA